jgi:hypothetical protein
MNDNSTLLYILFGIIGLVLSVLIMRWIFSIDRHLKNQKAMIALLLMICRKHGVTDDEMQKVRNAYEVQEP